MSLHDTTSIPSAATVPDETPEHIARDEAIKKYFERLEKILWALAMEYVRSLIPILVGQLYFYRIENFNDLSEDVKKQYIDGHKDLQERLLNWYAYTIEASRNIETSKEERDIINNPEKPEELKTQLKTQCEYYLQKERATNYPVLELYPIADKDPSCLPSLSKPVFEKPVRIEIKESFTTFEFDLSNEKLNNIASVMRAAARIVVSFNTKKNAEQYGRHTYFIRDDIDPEAHRQQLIFYGILCELADTLGFNVSWRSHNSLPFSNRDNKIIKDAREGVKRVMLSEDKVYAAIEKINLSPEGAAIKTTKTKAKEIEEYRKEAARYFSQPSQPKAPNEELTVTGPSTPPHPSKSKSS